MSSFSELFPRYDPLMGLCVHAPHICFRGSTFNRIDRCVQMTMERGGGRGDDERRVYYYRVY